MKKLFITLLAALTLFAAVPQMCFAEEPTTPPTVEQGEGEVIRKYAKETFKIDL